MFTLPGASTVVEHKVVQLDLEREESLISEGEDDDEQVMRPTSAERRRKEDKDREVALRDHTGSVESLKFFVSSKGRLRLASGSLDTTIRIWNPLSPAAGASPPVAVLEGHAAAVMAIDAFHVPAAPPRAAQPQPTAADAPEVSPAGASRAARPGLARLVSGSEDGTLRVWDPEGPSGSQGCLATLKGHRAAVFGVACFCDEAGLPRAASVSEDATVLIWDPLVAGVNGPLLVLEGHSAWVCDVAAFDTYAPHTFVEAYNLDCPLV
jgi:WD40 repeat protein